MRQTTKQIVVAAYNEEDIEENFDWEDDVKIDWYEYGNHHITEITELEMLPASFYGEVPINEYGDKVSPPKSCEEILQDANWEEWGTGRYQNIIDETTAEGLINGAAILRPPVNSKEIYLYMRLNVYAVKSGVYFTTVSPLPAELEPYFVCYSIRPRGLHQRDSE